MTRICHITTSHEAYDTRILRHECASLAQAGFDVHLVAPHVREEIVDGVHIVPMPRAASFLDRIVRTPRRAIALAESVAADLYHFHDPELVPWMRYMARRVDRPVVWDAHENYGFTIPQFNSLRIPPVSEAVGWWFNRMEIRACLQYFAGVVTTTETMAERYARRGIKTCIAGNFADISTIAYPPGVPRSVRPRFISTGGQFLDRGVMQIVDAFNLLDPAMGCELAFWGMFFPPGLSDDIRRRASAVPSSVERLLIGGPYPWKVLVGELIPTAWAGCVLFNPEEPNDLQGHPNRFFECWANGVPVIATSGTEVARMIQEEEGGFVVERNNPQAIAGAFRTLAEDPDLARKMGLAGRRAVETKYNWRTGFQNILRFYSDLGITA